MSRAEIVAYELGRKVGHTRQVGYVTGMGASRALRDHMGRDESEARIRLGEFEFDRWVLRGVTDAMTETHPQV